MSILQSNMSTRARITSLNSEMTSLQTTFDDYVKNYQNLRTLINGRAIHPNATSFITPLDFEVESIVNQNTGGWSNTSDSNEFWVDIKELYMWVVANIEYRSDGLSPNLPIDPGNSLRYFEDMWQFANETINLKKGDCEDQAILLCSMIRCYAKGLIGTHCVWISSSTSSHFGVQITEGGNILVIFDPVGNYYSKNFRGFVVSNDVTKEINNWLDYSKPIIGSDVYVSGVFCEEFDVRFVSTSQYIVWIENNIEEY